MSTQEQMNQSNTPKEEGPKEEAPLTKTPTPTAQTTPTQEMDDLLFQSYVACSPERELGGEGFVQESTLAEKFNKMTGESYKRYVQQNYEKPFPKKFGKFIDKYSQRFERFYPESLNPNPNKRRMCVRLKRKTRTTPNHKDEGPKPNKRNKRKNGLSAKKKTTKRSKKKEESLEDKCNYTPQIEGHARLVLVPKCTCAAGFCNMGWYQAMCGWICPFTDKCGCKRCAAKIPWKCGTCSKCAPLGLRVLDSMHF